MLMLTKLLSIAFLPYKFDTAGCRNGLRLRRGLTILSLPMLMGWIIARSTANGNKNLSGPFKGNAKNLWPISTI